MNLPFGTICQKNARASLWLFSLDWTADMDGKKVERKHTANDNIHIRTLASIQVVQNKVTASIHRLQACNYKISSSLEESKCFRTSKVSPLSCSSIWVKQIANKNKAPGAEAKNQQQQFVFFVLKTDKTSEGVELTTIAQLRWFWRGEGKTIMPATITHSK